MKNGMDVKSVEVDILFVEGVQVYSRAVEYTDGLRWRKPGSVDKPYGPPCETLEQARKMAEEGWARMIEAHPEVAALCHIVVHPAHNA